MNTISFFGASFVLAFAAVGCAAPADGAGSDNAALSEQGSKDPSKDPNANAGKPHIESVTANGSGCRGTDAMTASISEDGSSVSIDLHSEEVSVARGESFSIADCTIMVRVADAQGHAFALESFETNGYASLHGDGMKADEQLNAYIQGAPAAGQQRQKHFDGTLPGARYTFGEAIDDGASVWSPCGGGRDLNVLDRVVLKNNADKSGFGYMGAWNLKLALRWRTCE